MQSVNASLQTELDKGQVDPIVLLDLYEFYASDYTPGVSGFDPADAIETFAAETITWNGIAYRRELVARGDINKNMGEKSNSVTLSFSNISRYMATLAQNQEIEGLFLVIRCVSPSVTTDSLVLFTGRCEKPSDIDKKTFTLAARQDFGNINQTLPPRKFTAEDPEGRLPTDPLFEGIDLLAINGSLTFPQVVPSTSFFGRLFGRRKTVYVTQQWSSVDSTPYGQVIPEIFGRCQMQLIPFAWADKGSHVGYLMAVSNGPIEAVTNLRSRNEGLSDPVCSFQGAPAVVHLGDAGGTGTNNGNTCQWDLAGGRYFSHLAYIEGASVPPDPEAAVATQEEPPTITALVKGRIVTLPDSAGVYNQTGWSDNPVHVSRFILTDADWVNIDPSFMEDSVNYQTSLHCDFPLIDDSNTLLIPVINTDINQAGVSFTRYLQTGVYNPQYFLYNELGGATVPEFQDGPYVAIDLGDPPPDPSDPGDPTYISQKPLIKRYTLNCPITDEVKAVDFLYKTVFPAFKGFMRVNKYGRYEIRSEQPSDSTRLRTATAVGDTSIPVLDITPWKVGPDLLKGRVLLGFGLITSEVRTPSAAVYSTSGNSITLTASNSGSVTATASGATLSGGSSTVPASGTVTIGGTPAAGDSITATIDGIAVVYVLESIDTTETAAAMLAFYINANQRLNKFLRASWVVASPTVITVTCTHGALTVPALLKTHAAGIADPSSAPTVAASSGGALAAGTYLVAYADVNGTGATVLTPTASIAVTANQKIDLSALPALTGTSRDFYLSEKAGSTNLRFVTSRANNSNFSISTVPEPGAAIPPAWNTTAEEMIRVAMSFATNSQDVYPAWTPSTVVLLNDIYLPFTTNGHKYQVTTGGTTGTSEPTWNTAAGSTTTSGSAVFTEIGSTVLQQAGLSRSNVLKESFKWPLGSRQASVNQIKGNFRDAKNDFALTPFTVNDRDHQTQVKKVYPLEIDLSGVDNLNQMKRLGNGYLSKNREGDWFDSLGTGPAGLVLEEGDVICASDDSGGLINVATRIEDLVIRPNHDVLINQARKYSTEMFSDDVGAHRIPIPSTLKFVQTKNTDAVFVDNFALKEADAIVPGFYLAASHDLSVSGDWRGWALYADYGDGYSKIAQGDVAASIGTCSTTLATPSDPTVFDRTNSVSFTLKYYESATPFSSVTEADLLANPYLNLFLVGSEYIQAATIVNSGGGVFTVSTLLRGRFATDRLQLTHGASERVVYLNGAQQLIPISVVRLNAPFNYKLVTTNQDVADASPVSFTWTGGTVKPPSPVNLRGRRNTIDDLIIQWTRRERWPVGLRDLAGTPLSEEKEVYILEIYSGTTLKRQIRNPNLDLTERINFSYVYDPANILSYLG